MLHRFIITPLSPWATPLRSDTLHGLLLCAILETEGESALKRAIQDFQADQIPFVCSSVFPENALPAPVLPPVPRKRFAELQVHDSHGKNLTLYKAMREYKPFCKRPYISLELWERHSHKLSQEALFLEWCKALPGDRERLWPQAPGASGLEFHNSISRSSNTVLEGGLFSVPLRYFVDDESLHLYVRTGNVSRVQKLLEHIGCLGFGRDSGTGKGRFKVRLDDCLGIVQLSSDHTAAEPQLALLLSLFSSSSLDGLDGYYRTEVKQGYVGIQAGESNPFKKPFFAISEGAVLRTLPQGRHVLHVHSNPEIVQICHPITLPCSCPKEVWQ